MTSLSYTANDSLTMLRRNLLHARRYPAMVFSIIVTPVLLLLVFNYFFGSALNTGIGGGSHNGKYIDYLAPGMILMIPAWMVVVHCCVHRDGPEQGHRQPVPHHGDFPDVDAHRPRRRLR